MNHNVLGFVTNSFSFSVTKETGSNITDTPGSIGLSQSVPEDKNVDNNTEREARLMNFLYKIILSIISMLR